MVWGLAQSANRPDFEPSLSTQVLKVRYTISEPSHLVTLVPDPTVATLLIMTEVRAYSFTNHSLSTVRGCTNPSKRNSPVYLHDSPISEEVCPKLLWRTSADVQVDLININSSSQSGPNQRSESNSSDRRSTRYNESLQRPVRRLSQSARAHISDVTTQKVNIAGTRRGSTSFDKGLNIYQRCRCRHD